jgi:hypothetical protein
MLSLRACHSQEDLNFVARLFAKPSHRSSVGDVGNGCVDLLIFYTSET